jgi:hypothetical protein
MAAKAVNVTARSLSHAAKHSKTTVFCYFFILYIAKAVGNDLAVGTALAPSGRKRPPEKICYLSLEKTNLKQEFHFYSG